MKSPQPPFGKSGLPSFSSVATQSLTALRVVLGECEGVGAVVEAADRVEVAVAGPQVVGREALRHDAVVPRLRPQQVLEAVVHRGEQVLLGVLHDAVEDGPGGRWTLFSPQLSD